MSTEEVEGPVKEEERGPLGTRVQIDIPVGTSLVLSGSMFAYSGYFLYHTLKAMHKLSKEM
jgi:hypothetical protein